jgi:carboxypeptidase Q
MPLRTVVILTASFACAAPSARAQSPELAVVDRIKAEAFDRSQVMETLRNLTDVHGARLTGSPQFDAAAAWTVDRLKGYGLSNVHLEAWGPFGRSWSATRYSVEQIEPVYMQLETAPLAWSGPTAGAVEGTPIIAPLDVSFLRGPKRIAADFEKFKPAWTGKLRGRIVLLSAVSPESPREEPLFSRFTAADLERMAVAPDPAAKLTVTNVDELPWPERREDLSKMLQSMPPALEDRLFDRFDELMAQRAAWFASEGVSAVLMSDERAREGLLAAEAAGAYKAATPLAPPTFVVTSEQYARLVRLAEHHDPVTVRVSLETRISTGDVDGHNIVAEIPGGARKDELVMVGAHFDSWHTGTGATDNGAGSAVMIEVMRILKTLGVPLQRTVRLGLWSGEEQGLLGSRAYVAAHFGNPQQHTDTPEHARLSGYFNLDNGSGKIRGIYLQGHEAMRPLFEQWLAPFRDVGVTTITIRDTGGTDHLSFAAVGLPGFQFIQDALDYRTLTHHTSADTLDHAVPADLMQAAAVIAAVVYDAANSADRLPRRP